MEKYFDVYGGGGVEMGVSIDTCRCTTLTLGYTMICGNHIKAGFFNVIIQDIAVYGTND